MDKEGNTVDFLLTKQRKKNECTSFLINAIENNGKTELINIDKRGSNKHEIRVFNKRTYSKIKVRQCKYLNNIVEREHRFIKKRIVQCVGFKEFESAKRTLSGIGVVHMLRKKQLINARITMFKSFCSLVA